MKGASIQMGGWTEIVKLVGNKYYGHPFFNVSYVVLNYIKFCSSTEKSFIIILKLNQSTDKHACIPALTSK